MAKNQYSEIGLTRFKKEIQKRIDQFNGEMDDFDYNEIG